MRSSISSSEKSFPKRGFPKALVAAMVIIVVLEIILHLLPKDMLLGYGQGLSSYYEVKHTIQTRGPAEVAVLGTSRGRESIVVPELVALVRDRIGRDITAANYSLAGSHADEQLQVARLLMASESKPAIILYFLSPLILQGDEANLQRLGILGRFPDMFAGRTGQVIASSTEKPFWNLRNWIDRNYYTFRYRHRFRYLMTSAIRRRQPISPIQGDYTMWQLYAAERSLETHPVSVERIQGYVARLLDENGQYVIGERHLTALAETIALCQTHDVPIVIMAAAISPDLDTQLPDQVKNTFHDSIAAVTGAAGLEFYTMAEIGADLDRGNFREQSHLNRSGGEIVTRAVVDRFVVPALSGQ